MIKRLIKYLTLIFLPLSSLVGCGKSNKNISILAIGNSFSDDGLYYLYDVLKELGYEQITVGNLYIGGCALETHLYNLENDLPAYEFRLNNSGEWKNYPSYKASSALKEYDWDYVSIQQVSATSGLIEHYQESDINNLYYLIKQNSNHRPKFVWHMTWAYQSDSDHYAFAYYDYDQIKMYNSIVSCTKERIVNNEYNPLIIPSGTTIQNMRTSILGDHLTRDGYHLELTYARYAAALTWASVITNLSIDNIPNINIINDDELAICKKAVNDAKNHPFEITTF